ncbi:sodium-dependent transporter [Marinobacter vulgaris]|uniref:Sodium-dependent transporter n=1 Tax=Marinobacter vulgaris TaxID=1928331 RepID=A0A2V3ZPW8_9GAMM|nr:sodium-dependent transporter [Marinobacter vulgaris]PXX93565.1 sodium-dependent transporter [Marinobacter vulgaris]TSJ72418.1 sodium-dependent transporter [Marinobacter vulgaris]
MPIPYETPTGSWTRPTTFFWAATGATFGLANVWQFPYLAGQHGGGLFVLLYLFCLVLITLPLMVTEATMGRHSRHGLVLAMDGYVRRARCSRWWVWAGRMGIVAALLVLSFTAVFGAIALAYVFYGAMGRFIGAGEAEAAATLSALVSDPDDYRVFMAWHGFFLLLVIWVSTQGVVDGLERAVRVVAPLMLLMLLVLGALAAWAGEFRAASDYMLSFRPADVTPESLQAALFHAFFTLGLGMGVWTLFGAYTPVGTRLKRSVLAVVLMDTLIAIVAGLAIYSFVPGGNATEGERGFGLLFLSLPVALSDLPGSQFLIATVFLVVVMIVWTTSLSLLEPVVGWFREWTGAPRAWSVFLMAILVWLLGLGSLLSFNAWSEVRLAGGTVFRWVELASGGLLIPLVSILIAVFAGWCLTRNLTFTILGAAPGLFRSIWFWVMRLVLPLVVAYIGIQYTAVSLLGMCSTGSAALWCGPAEVLATESIPLQGAGENPPEAEDEGGKDSQLEGAEPVQTEGDGELEGANGNESGPNNGEILYHSV